MNYVDRKEDDDYDSDGDESKSEREHGQLRFPIDIETRLDDNELLWHKEQMNEMKRDSFGGFNLTPPQQPPNFDYIDVHGKRMYDTFKRFLTENGLEEMDKNGFLWLYRKRFIVMVDRRGSDSPDTLWFVRHHVTCDMILSVLVTTL